MNGLSEELAAFSPQEKTQLAFDEAQRLQGIGNLTLHPWTTRRQSLGMILGCQVILAVGPSVSRFVYQGTYAYALRDLIIFLWVSTRDDAEVARLHRSKNPLERIDDAFDWADSVGIAYGSELYLAGTNALDRVVRQILDSLFVVPGAAAEVPEEVKKNGTGPPGKSASPTARRKRADTRPTS